MSEVSHGLSGLEWGTSSIRLGDRKLSIPLGDVGSRAGLSRGHDSIGKQLDLLFFLKLQSGHTFIHIIEGRCFRGGMAPTRAGCAVPPMSLWHHR